MDHRVMVWDLDGISWHEMPMPSRFHRCWAQTRGFMMNHVPLTMIERCPCGASRYETAGMPITWIARNERRKNGA
jgi:hypothetical protein